MTTILTPGRASIAPREDRRSKNDNGVLLGSRADS